MPCTKGLSDKVELTGELYWDSGKRNFYEAQTHLKNDDPLLKFAIFAFYQVDMTYMEQWRLLKLMANYNEQRHIVEGKNAYSHAEVEYYHKEFLKDGYEGTVIKPLAMKSERSWVKWKPFESADLVVLGISKDKSSLAVGTPEGNILGHCSYLHREKEVNLVIGKYEFTGETKEDYLIKPEIVCEVRYLDIIEKSGHLRNPVFVRFREDKKC